MDVVPTEYATAYPNSVLRDSLALLTKVRGFSCYCELFDFYPCALRFRMRRRYKGGAMLLYFSDERARVSIVACSELTNSQC